LRTMRKRFWNGNFMNSRGGFIWTKICKCSIILILLYWMIVTLLFIFFTNKATPLKKGDKWSV
jgi:hypothetical protein